MFRKAILGVVLISIALLSGCASVPMAPKEQDMALKSFAQPGADKAGLYVFRNSLIGQALKKKILLDGIVIGETANKVYFYKEISLGNHTISTESEFSDNSLTFEAKSMENYFAEQYIKPGVFVGGANLRMVSPEEGKKEILECQLAK